MVGENIYHFDFPEKFNLILGNEETGMRPEVEKIGFQKTLPFHDSLKTIYRKP